MTKIVWDYGFSLNATDEPDIMTAWFDLTDLEGASVAEVLIALKKFPKDGRFDMNYQSISAERPITVSELTKWRKENKEFALTHKQSRKDILLEELAKIEKELRGMLR